MNLHVLEQAEWEARDAACWYEDRQQGLGDAFLDEYVASLEKIQQDPELFARLETVDSSRNIRRRIMRRFPYMVVFEILAGELMVLAVSHASRRPDYWID